MKSLDQFVALCLIVFFSIYLYQSYNFELLPFERNMSFKPDTMPKGIGILGLIISCIVLFSAKGEKNKDNANWQQFRYKQLLFIIIGMASYASLLKPMGFIVATTLFLVGCAAILGERMWAKLFIISIVSSLLIWLLVDKTLGIYLYPIPAIFKSLL